MNHKQARTIAEHWLESLKPFIIKGEIAGSLRRRCEDIDDIDIVVMPRTVTLRPLFGDESATVHDFLYDELCRLHAAGSFKVHNGLKPGFRNTKLMLPQGLKLDLSAVRPPAQWGVIFLLRTGPADFSKWIVTNERAGGVLPHQLIFENGAIGHAHYVRKETTKGPYAGQIISVRARKDVIETPDEESIFKLCGLNYIEPAERQAHWDWWKK